MKVKVLICYHKPGKLIKDDIMTPIHVGRAVALQKKDRGDPDLSWLMENMIGDDTGDNISALNLSYNELTGLYWAWKNYDKLDDPDYIGLMHYRRHFVFNEDEIGVYNIPDVDSPEYLSMIGYSPESLKEILSKNDFICHLGRVDGIYKHYLANHRHEDMELALKILNEHYPEYTDAANEYMMQDVGNFCNMFVFPKSMFFDYCEFVFGILEEFGRRIDISEKRMFISERLSGIFIYKRVQEGASYKVLPINFAPGTVSVPVVYGLSCENAYHITVSMTSVLKNKKGSTAISFYLVYKKDTVSSEYLERFLYFERNYNCSVTFIGSEYEIGYCPLFISELLKDVRKCIVFSPEVIAMQDLAEFFLTCNTDDYYICGLPEGRINNCSKARRIRGSIYAVNCERLRKHNILNSVIDSFKTEKCNEIIDRACCGEIGHFPSWFITDASLYNPEYVIPSKYKTRGRYQLEATWRSVMYYDDTEPWTDIQGLYSCFWWKYAALTPMLFKMGRIDADKFVADLNSRQDMINRIGGVIERNEQDEFKSVLYVKNDTDLNVRVESNQIRIRSSAASRSEFLKYTVLKKELPDNFSELSILKKLICFFQVYGFKDTIRKVISKFL